MRQKTSTTYATTQAKFRDFLAATIFEIEDWFFFSLFSEDE